MVRVDQEKKEIGKVKGENSVDKEKYKNPGQTATKKEKKGRGILFKLPETCKIPNAQFATFMCSPLRVINQYDVANSNKE